mmetsp:Transcript_21248/g.30063  ORF Transcript_21248/g.30063 Transcript_21248/m.30063 type:complete len:97 (+) Transcript_21248:406-696(+)
MDKPSLSLSESTKTPSQSLSDDASAISTSCDAASCCLGPWVTSMSSPSSSTKQNEIVMKNEVLLFQMPRSFIARVIYFPCYLCTQFLFHERRQSTI